MDSDPEAYRLKTEKIRQSYEQRKAAATNEKGLVIVFTGIGQGQEHGSLRDAGCARSSTA